MVSQSRPIVHFAKSYIDQLYVEKDLFALHNVISAVIQERPLPEQFWLFLRLWEWCCSTRSGVWTYFEAVPVEQLEKTAFALEKFGFPELANQFRLGMSTWNEPGACGPLDCWIDGNWSELEKAAFSLIANDRELLSDMT
jgi:hypothetical protein